MLTCFIRNDFDDGKFLSVYSILIFPVVFVSYSIYAFIRVFKLRKVRYNHEFKIAIIKYLIYSALYLAFYSPTVILYIVTINQAVYIKYTFFSWFSYLCALSNLLVNLILSIYRIIEGYVKFDIKNFFVKSDTLESECSSQIDQEAVLIEETEGLDGSKRFGTVVSETSILQTRFRKGTLLAQIHAGNVKGVIVSFI
jgi:hypothetical protein